MSHLQADGHYTLSKRYPKQDTTIQLTLEKTMVLTP